MITLPPLMPGRAIVILDGFVFYGYLDQVTLNYEPTAQGWAVDADMQFRVIQATAYQPGDPASDLFQQQITTRPEIGGAQE